MNVWVQRGLIIVLALVVASWAFLFRVHEREIALKTYLGQITRADYTPGLYFRLPVLEQVHKFDWRLLNLDTQPARYLTGEKKDLIVDSYVRWRIQDVEQYFKATSGDERRAGLLLFQKINDTLRAEFGKRTVKEVVSGERGSIMDIVTESSNRQAKELGMRIEDVRIKRIDLPEDVSESVYNRMRAERERVARDFRSRGLEQAERIRANADRDRTIILAEAYREAEVLRGEGDAVAAETYADAYGTDSSFYSLYRSLNAYRNSFSGANDMLLIEPDSEFFRFFKNSEGVLEN